jgi:hypothetical protein
VKKLIPFAVLDKIQPIIDQHKDLLKVVKDPKFSFSFKDSDSDSDFYFRVHHRANTGKHQIDYKPISEESVNQHSTEADINEVVKQFTNWVKILEKYAKLQTIYDDPILQQYEDEFFKDLEIDEPDADEKPFDFARQLYLDQYISNIKGLLNDYKERATDEQILEIKSIESDCDDLRQNITIISKNEAVKKLSKIWAKGRKYGLELIKDMLKEFKKEAVSWIAKKMLENPEGLFNTIKGLLDI